MSQYVEVGINANRYVAQLMRSMASAMGDLRNTLRSVEDGTFMANAEKARPSAVVQFQYAPSIIKSNEVSSSACKECFLSLVRSLITYIDQLIALKMVIANRITLQHGFSSSEELYRFIEEHIESTFKKVSKNTRLTNPKKIAEFPSLSEFAKNASLSYFEMRRCLEHHDSLPTEEINLHFIKTIMRASDRLVDALPVVVEKGTLLTVQMSPSSTIFPPNRKIELTEENIECVEYTIKHIIARELQEGV